MIQPHDGVAEIKHTFGDALMFLVGREFRLVTRRGTAFAAKPAQSNGRDVIRFLQNGSEYARSYRCCWGHYYNCNRTRIGMYCEALDGAIRKRSEV